MEISNNKKVHSLSELLNVLSEDRFRHKSFYYRGESALYQKRASSAYRENVALSPYSIMSLLTEFQREVGAELTLVEMENFLAFAQHHKLATNLIDITTSILIAAFFASAENESEQGYIYCFDEQKCLYFPHDVNPQDNLQLFNGLQDLNENIIANLIKMFSEYYYNLYRFTDFYELMLFNLKENSESQEDWLWEAIEEELVKFKEKKFEATKILDSKAEMIPEVQNQLLYSLYILSEKINQTIKYLPDYQDIVKAINIVEKTLNLRWILNDPIPIIKSLLYILYLIIEPRFGSGTTYIKKLPNIIYQSSFNFGRIKEQQGLFIFQDSFREYKGTASENIRYYYQEIIEDELIIIQDKKKLREELSMLGINEATVYGDPDSIAKEIMKRVIGK